MVSILWFANKSTCIGGNLQFFFFFFLSATVGEFCSSEVAGLPDMASTDVDQNASGLELLDTPIRPMIPERGQGVMHHSWDQSMY